MCPCCPSAAVHRAPVQGGRTCVATRFSYSASSCPTRKGLRLGSSSEVEGRLPALGTCATGAQLNAHNAVEAGRRQQQQQQRQQRGGGAAAFTDAGCAVRGQVRSAEQCSSSGGTSWQHARKRSWCCANTTAPTAEGLVRDEVLRHVLRPQRHAVLANGQRVSLRVAMHTSWLVCVSGVQAGLHSPCQWQTRQPLRTAAASSPHVKRGA